MRDESKDDERYQKLEQTKKATRRTWETNPRTMLQTGKPPREDSRHLWIKSRMNISCRFRIILVITVDVDQFKIYVELKSNLGRLQMRKVVTMAMSTKVNLSSRPLRLRRCRTCVRLSVILCKYRVLKIFTFSDYNYFWHSHLTARNILRLRQQMAENGMIPITAILNQLW